MNDTNVIGQPSLESCDQMQNFSLTWLKPIVFNYPLLSRLEGKNLFTCVKVDAKTLYITW